MFEVTYLAVKTGKPVSPASPEHQIDIHNGRVVQHNFDTYRVARMSDIPVIDIDIVQGDLAKLGVVR
ncbi:hypothetical protein AX768_26025 [Burkholderia sp. PAMC 28687]|uniref:Uncharacterized protein n=1 Tax=Caballeronia sordidicola TaxID=196367 RepID=A0A242M517_CABSO|nr:MULTISPECIES: hypothetical protein [Burkholderiaceae]AMM17639.1 hypothetical protein AX768_26025 [Burkholderia sp. PAMC 28687]OTP66121.1 hypothetical protein PAMC26510_35920 [Caballeronia sordidicola]